MRTILAACVLLGGAAAALLFRHPSPPAKPPAPGVSERLVLRKQVAATSKTPAGSGAAARQGARSALPRRKAPTILAPMDPGQPPPALARTYPRPPRFATSRWGTSVGMAPPGAGPSGIADQIHRVADGDTLESLARRYLGSADRAMEIYQANRELLTRPDILPIGAALKIPARGAATGNSSEPIGPKSLAPIPSVP